jgi:hypothetical protein
MAWQNPKTDWTIDPKNPDAEDFNRIEGNIGFLKQDIETKKGAIVNALNDVGLETELTDTHAQIASKITAANQGTKIYTPGTANITIPKGFHSGQGYVKGDANLVPENIRDGKSIFGVSGTLVEGYQSGYMLTLDDIDGVYLYAETIIGSSAYYKGVAWDMSNPSRFVINYYGQELRKRNMDVDGNITSVWNVDLNSSFSWIYNTPMVTDTSGNIYLLTCNLNRNAICVVKYNTNGTYVGSTTVVSGTDSMYRMSISGNTLWVLYEISVSGSYVRQIRRVTTGLSLGATITSTATSPNQMDVDNDGNLYVVYDNRYIRKYNTSGTLLNSYDTNDTCGAICVDPESGDCFFMTEGSTGHKVISYLRNDFSTMYWTISPSASHILAYNKDAKFLLLSNGIFLYHLDETPKIGRINLSEGSSQSYYNFVPITKHNQPYRAILLSRDTMFGIGGCHISLR